MSTDIPLRLARVEKDGKLCVTVEVEMGGGVLDVWKLKQEGVCFSGVDVGAVDEIRQDMFPLYAEALAKAKEAGMEKYLLRPGEYTLKSPVARPEKVICIGMNYVDHCTEQNIPVPVEPVIFSKFPSSITDPNGPVILPEETECLDYEVELAFVISKEGKKIKESEAMSYVAGYCVAHDVSARDWQLHKNGGQWLIGKTFDTFCPLGPSLVTTAAISDPHKLGIRCRVNGETLQDSNTEQLVHKTETLVSFISRFITLKPGDVILTGTPPGVGCFKKPPRWLKKGDVVECEIDEIGKITNIIQ